MRMSPKISEWFARYLTREPWKDSRGKEANAVPVIILLLRTAEK